jgi:hypothetical protein
MEMYKEPYTENFAFPGDILKVVSNPVGAITGGIADGFTAMVEPILNTVFSVFGKIFGKWWITVQYFFLYLAFLGTLVFILIMVFRIQLQAGVSAKAMGMVSGMVPP